MGPYKPTQFQSDTIILNPSKTAETESDARRYRALTKNGKFRIKLIIV